MPRPPAPGAFQTKDRDTADDLRRMRVWLEQLARDVDALQAAGGGGAGTITEITSSDLSVTVTNGTGPVVDLSVPSSGGGDITAVTAGSGLTGGGTSGAVSLAADFGTAAGKVTEGNDARLPTSGEKAALAGTSGTPDSGNKYVTDADARNTNSRAPTGAAGGDLGGTYPNPTVNITADVRANFWARPATPHASDVEFDSSTLPAAFSLWDMSTSPPTQVSPGTGISVYDTSGPGTGACRVEANKPGRRSWVLFQPDNENRNWFYGTQITIPSGSAGFVIRTRLFSLTRFSGGSNNAGNIKLWLIQDQSGKPATIGGASDTGLVFGWEKDAGSMKLGYLSRTAGAQSGTAIGPEYQGTFGAVDGEIALVKNPAANNDWFGFFRTPFITNVMASASAGIAHGNTVWVGWLFCGVDNDLPGCPIMGADYLRFDDSATGFIP